MRGGALPPALLCAALGLALAFAPRRAMPACFAALALAALAASFLSVDGAWIEAAFLGCWASVVLAAASVHLPGGLGGRTALAVSVNTGFWAGAVVASAGGRADLLKALPAALVCLPAAWLVSHHRGVVVKVVASWLIAVAVLAATLPLVATAGYEPDHMD